MSVYKKIESVDRTSNVIHYEHFLSASTEGLSSISFISGSTNNKYWNSLNVLFYTSGSPTLSNVFDCHNCGDGVDQFDLPHTNFTIQNAYNPQHVNKFHGYPKGTLFDISEHYYGDRIKPGTFELIDKSSGQNISIKDDNARFFDHDDDVSDNFYSLEKSMYQVISKEMLNTMYSVKEMNNLVGKEFFVGNVKLKAHDLCRPCKYLQEKLKQSNIIKEFLLKGGIRCEILSDGKIVVGDDIKTKI